jgi:hypothetical protein
VEVDLRRSGESTMALKPSPPPSLSWLAKVDLRQSDESTAALKASHPPSLDWLAEVALRRSNSSLGILAQWRLFPMLRIGKKDYTPHVVGLYPNLTTCAMWSGRCFWVFILKSYYFSFNWWSGIKLLSDCLLVWIASLLALHVLFSEGWTFGGPTGYL